MAEPKYNRKSILDYDYFVGKVRYDTGRESKVILYWKTGSVFQMDSLKHFCRYIGHIVNQGEKLTFKHSPGYVEPSLVSDREINEGFQELKKVLGMREELIDMTPDVQEEPTSKSGKQWRINPGMNYVPFNREELVELMGVYETLRKPENWPDPFRDFEALPDF